MRVKRIKTNDNNENEPDKNKLDLHKFYNDFKNVFMNGNNNDKLLVLLFILTMIILSLILRGCLK